MKMVGTVTRVIEYGVFVDFPHVADDKVIVIDGFLHRTDSIGKTPDMTKRFKLGDRIGVEVKEIDRLGRFNLREYMM